MEPNRDWASTASFWHATCVIPIHSVNAPALRGRQPRLLTTSTSVQIALYILNSLPFSFVSVDSLSLFVTPLSPRTVILHRDRTRLSLPTLNSDR
jgi:hypothetical protein